MPNNPCETESLTISHEQFEPVRYRVIEPGGEDFGVMLATDALDIAKELELDLVSMDEASDPPTYRVCDYGKLRHEQDHP